MLRPGKSTGNAPETIPPARALPMNRTYLGPEIEPRTAPDRGPGTAAPVPMNRTYLAPRARPPAEIGAFVHHDEPDIPAPGECTWWTVDTSDT